jgi:leader peptidase (prepilin peptidase)/N-methyltransferase
LLSILAQRFQCRHCKNQLPIIYFISELTGGLLCVFCFAQGLHLSSLYTFLFLSMGILLSLTDSLYMIVEPKILFSFFILLTTWHLWFAFPIFMKSSLLIAVFLYSLNRIFPQSIGGGDILLLACWSLLLGWENILLLVFSASVCALLYSLFYWCYSRKKKQHIPFVPFLTIGLFFVFLLT